jgi:uncharacterized membrane protein
VARWWQDGRYQSLAGTMANGTTGAGVVVGQDLDGWAVTWRGTTAARLPRPACSVTSTANAVNATGSAVGLYDDCSGYGAALWRNGQFVRLPSLRDGAEALDINAAGDAVGISTCYTCEIATLWRQGVPVDLNSHVAPDLGWVVLRANAIADDGSITGTGWFRERAQAFVLRPPAAQQSL